MADENDTQAQALIAALAPKIAAAIIPQLAAQVETQIKGVVAKNDELLDKLAIMKKDAEIAENGKMQEALIAQGKALIESAKGDMKSRLAPDGTFDARKAGEPIRLKRSDARNVKAYRAAKAAAAEQGVALEIVPDA